MMNCRGQGLLNVNNYVAFCFHYLSFVLLHACTTALKSFINDVF